ncbi:hypothetical protein AB0B63_07015 [Micromonospora sp. NPDC049081]|uniref:hypothetical protein n=1 Tax=Micromonospora sp. NPDC049081 TaxID=3155150 RepID=UPI0033D78480
MATMTMTEMTAERAATEIRRAYNTWTSQYGHDHNDGWMPVGTLAERVDLTHEQITDGVLHLARTDRQFDTSPQSYAGLRTALDDEYAVWVGGQWKHLLTWS